MMQEYRYLLDESQESIIIVLDAIVDATLRGEIDGVTCSVSMADGTTGSYIGGKVKDIDKLLKEIEQLKRELRHAQY